jgi:hypothetical protein
MSERVERLERKMKNEERRRRKNNLVITGWRGKGNSKRQIKEDIENFIKENIEEAKVKDCYNINKGSGNERVEWERKSDERKRKLREKKITEKIFIDNDFTKQEREIQKKLRTIAKEEKREEKENGKK